MTKNVKLSNYKGKEQKGLRNVNCIKLKCKYCKFHKRKIIVVN